MPVPIRMPDLGTTVDEIKIVAWLVKEGDSVKRGDFLAEIETDKATGELESVAEGVLLKQVAAEGDVVETGEVLAYVGEPGDTAPETGEEPETDEGGRSAGALVPPAAKRPRVAPVVQNLARKLGIDPASVQGTGRGGTVTREDVLRAGEAATEAGNPPAERLSRSQSAVAKAVLKSVHEIPHLRIEAVADMTAAQRIREQSSDVGTRISHDAIFLKAMAKAVQTVPLLAARLDGDRVIRPEEIHLALAIGVENDLFLPVIRDVTHKDLASIQAEIADLASQARASTLRPEQMTGACMTLSNLGMYPVETFDAIIFPEHSAILAVGATRETPTAVDDRVEVRPLVSMKLAVDHRLINGRAAAQFLTEVKETVESGRLG